MRISPLRQRMIDDMTARHFSEKAQKDYIRCVKNLAAFIGRPPATACVMISATDPGNRGDVVIHVKNSTIASSINYNWQKYVSRLLSKIASSKVTAPPRAYDFYSGV